MKNLHNKKNRLKVVIFDLDGVLIDSKKNMEISWSQTIQKFKLKNNFEEYFKHIGKPFKEILISLKIKKNFLEIENYFSKVSKKYTNKIKVYNGVYKIIKFLKKKKIKIGIFTSKNRERTLKFLKKFDIKVDFVQCPQNNYRGKPHPDLLLKILKDNMISSKDCLYIGDTKSDFQAAKRARIKFILATYGYLINIKKNKFFIKNILELKKYL